MIDARALWQTLEPLHAVVYYGPTMNAVVERLGYDVSTRWPSYFALRAAPLGRVDASVVTRLFAGFSPATVARHVPSAWEVAPPDAVLAARLTGVRATLGELLGDVVESPGLREAAGLARRAAEAADVTDRPMAAANQALPWPDEPVLQLWQAATVLREHRGDGHLRALADAGLDPLEAMVQLASDSTVPEESFMSRGWTRAEWDAARLRLQDRGWIDDRGAATVEGHRRRDDLERETDRLASQPWAALGGNATSRFLELVGPWSAAVGMSGLLPLNGTLAFFREVGDAAVT